MKEKLLSLGKVSRSEVCIAVGLLASVVLLLVRLGSVPGKLSGNELQMLQSNLKLHTILQNPLNAPYKLIDYAALHIFGSSVTTARLTSAVFGLLAVVLFFAIMQRWHGRRTAWLATALFASSGWLLHVSRLGTAAVIWLVLPLVLVLLGTWIGKTERHGTALIVTAGLFGIMLFVPAGVWFVAAYAFLLRHEIAEHLQEAEARQRTGAIGLFAILTVALVFSLYRSPDLIRPWLGLPHTMPSVFSAIKVWISSLIFYPFIRGPYAPQLWLAHTPLLDVFTTAMFLLGAYFYASHFRNLRAQTFTVFALIGSILTALNGPAAMGFIVPLAYLIAATGLTYLLREWLTVFPRNPVARSVGIAFVTLVVACAATYHIAAYFVAWNHNPATTATFQHKP